MPTLHVKLTNGNSRDVEMTPEKLNNLCKSKALVQLPTGAGQSIYVNPAQHFSARTRQPDRARDTTDSS